jgi:SAM-dependent methyltransferase
LLGEEVLGRSDKILVSCGGALDTKILSQLEFQDFTITNLDSGFTNATAPPHWKSADAENLPFADGSFDWGMVHAGLHHCESPHRGLLELLRVSRKGVMVFEARDSFTMRLAIGLGLVPEYEIEAVALEGGTGGVRNGPIPNFIYRWTEREVHKTIESACAATVNEIRFFYGVRLPGERMTMSSPAKRMVAGILGAGLKVLCRAFPSQGNEFGFLIRKLEKNKPWIADGGLASDYKLGFDPGRYVRNEIA